MKIENQNLMFNFFQAVPKDVTIKMILTRKQYADWVVSAALRNNWEISREGKIHYEPLAEYMLEMHPRKRKEKYLKRHLTLHGKKIRLSKFRFFHRRKQICHIYQRRKCIWLNSFQFRDQFFEFWILLEFKDLVKQSSRFAVFSFCKMDKMLKMQPFKTSSIDSIRTEQILFFFSATSYQNNFPSCIFEKNKWVRKSLAMADEFHPT